MVDIQQSIPGDDAPIHRSAASHVRLPERQVHASGSSIREKVLEYHFLAAVTRELLRRGLQFDVLRGDVDARGSDIVIEANGVFRHVQLKGTVAGGKRASINVNARLATAPSGCVVWISYDPITFDFLSFRWFGGQPGVPLPDLGNRIVKHSKANAQGMKSERAGHRIIPGGRFDKLQTVAELVDMLFGSKARPHPISVRELLRHIRSRPADVGPVWLERVRDGDFTAIPEELTWNDAVEFAMLVDGYQLAEQLGLGEPSAFADAQFDVAGVTGTWPGDAGALWVSLFLEHRRWRFSEPHGPDAAQKNLLDSLVRQLRRSLIAVTRWSD